MPLGDDISAGIGQGMSQHDFSADAAAVMSAIESALAPEMFTGIGEQCASGISSGLASLGSTAYTAASGSLNSSTLMPIGSDAASGLASGITDYDLGSAASTAAGKVKTAVSSKLNSSTLTSIGSNVMQGLASGITSGASLAAAAAAAAARAVVAAAKAALQINSPSRVFRDEVGVMMMRGLGEGIEKETKAQAKVVRNAARYLTEEAQSNIVAGSVVTDNRQTYNQQSTVKLSGNNFYIRDDSDIHALAVEITQLGKRRQSGLGVRQGG
jgi:phage-related protein